MSMKINGKYRFRDITMRDFRSLGDRLGFKEGFVEGEVTSLSNLILKSAQELLIELNSDIRTSSEIYEPIYTVISNHCDRLRV